MTPKRAVLLIVCMILGLLLCACEDRGGNTGESDIIDNKDGTLTLTVPIGDTDASVRVVRKPLSDLSSYSIVRGDLAPDGEIDAAKLIYQVFNDLGTPLKLTTDWVKPGEEVPTDGNEILIGTTNRPETHKADLRINDFVICANDSHIAIYGGSENATLFAAQLFSDYFVEKEEQTVLVPVDELKVLDTYICDTLTVNGIPLWKYGVKGTENAVGTIKDFCVSVTGYESAEFVKAEQRIIIEEGKTDGICSVNVSGKDIIVTAEKDNLPLAARYFLSVLMEQGKFSRNGSEQHAEIILKESLLTEEMIKNNAPIEIFVSPTGNDANKGSKDAPLLTLAAAKEKAKFLSEETIAPVTVYFRGGDYYFAEGILFDETDSGTAAAPVTWRAFENETVNFIGGVKVDASLVKKAENQEIINRVQDKNAADRLMQIDLSSVVDKIPDFYSFGHTDNNSVHPMEVYVNGKALARSRYPNDIPGAGYLRNTGIIKNEDGTKSLLYDKETAEHLSKWSDHAKDDLYLFGFLTWDWKNEIYDAKGLDTEHKAVVLKGGLDSYFDSAVGGTRFYFFNLPEEIDVPGESYIDREARIAYFYPSDDFSADDIYISTLTEPMLTFNGTRHVVIEGVNFLYMRGNALNVRETDDFTLRNCAIMHTSSNAASFNGNRITISGCHVFDTSGGGFTVEGGSRAELISGDSIIENCEIHSINRTQSTDYFGIVANSVGMIIRNNKLYDSVHLMIKIDSNDVVIEYNEIYNCVTESADMGAIYCGRNPSIMGTVIRYNYFHDIGNAYGGTGQFSIYFDDGCSGADIYGNLFCRSAGTQYEGQPAQAAIMHNGAQFSHIHNNIFIDTAYGMRFECWGSDKSMARQDSWYLWLYDRWSSDGKSIIEKCSTVNFDSDIWHKRYDGTIWGQLYTYINEELITKYKDTSSEELKTIAQGLAPDKSNEIEHNVFINVQSPGTTDALNLHDNYISDDISFFENYQAGDYSLTSEGLAEIKEKIPAFEALPLDKIGIRRQ